MPSSTAHRVWTLSLSLLTPAGKEENYIDGLIHDSCYSTGLLCWKRELERSVGEEASLPVC